MKQSMLVLSPELTESPPDIPNLQTPVPVGTLVQSHVYLTHEYNKCAWQVDSISKLYLDYVKNVK